MNKKSDKVKTSPNIQLKESIKEKVVSSTTEPTTFCERLNKILNGESARSFALKINVLPATFHNYVKGTTEPTRTVLKAIAELKQINIEWLVTGNGPMMKEEASLPVPTEEKSLITPKSSFFITNLEGKQVEYQPNPDLVNIPVLSLEAACGVGTFSNENYITAMFSATREWLFRNLNRNPDHIYLIQAKGDSMIDTIKPNDIVFVDTEDAKSPSDGIWVFSVENQIFLKRLQVLPTKKLKVISDNPIYETYILDPDHTFHLLARYIATLSIKI